MDIINHFKNQADKAMQFLREQGVINDEDIIRANSEVEQEGSSIIREVQVSDNGSTKANSLSHSQSHSQSQSHQQSLSHSNSQSHSQSLDPQPSPNPYLTPHTASSPLPPLSKCIICHRQSKYRCPQCLISYCSLEHYKSHNLFCSQQFYKKQVTEQMKQLKSSTKERQQMRQMLKENNMAREQYDDLMMGSKINNSQGVMSQQRLMQMLQKIEQIQKQNNQNNTNKQVDYQKILKLTQQQTKMLQQYIANLQLNDNTDIEQLFNKTNPTKSSQQQLSTPILLMSQQPPYWLINDGLDYYFMQQLDIEQFSTSANMQLIIKRQMFSKRYRQDIKQLSKILAVSNNSKSSQTTMTTTKRVSPYVIHDVLQYLLVYVNVILAYNDSQTPISSATSAIKQQIFTQIMDSIIVDNLPQSLSAQSLAENQAAQHTFCMVRQNISNNIKNKQTKLLLQSWFKSNQVIASCKVIVKNKYLLVETFLRLLEFFESLEKDLLQIVMDKKDNNNVEDQKNVVDKINNNNNNKKGKLDRQSKKLLIKLNKYIKKIEFLLAYIKDEMTIKTKYSPKQQQIQPVTKASSSTLLLSLQGITTKCEQDLFRRLYRCLCQEETRMFEQQKQKKLFDQLNQQVKKVQTQGILFK